MMQANGATDISRAFGPDVPAEAVVTYRTIAAQVQSMQPRALTPDAHDSVIILIEFMRDHALKLHAQHIEAGAAIAVREKNVAKREHDVAILHRAVEAAMRSSKRKRWWR